MLNVLCIFKLYSPLEANKIYLSIYNICDKSDLAIATVP